jgi:hypothetical protein
VVAASNVARVNVVDNGGKTAMEADVARLTHWAFGNGQPGVEDRLKDHANRNLKQLEIDLRNEMNARDARQEIHHSDNISKFDKLEDGQEEIKSIVTEGRGMLKLAGWLSSAAALTWIILQIMHAISGHPITLGTLQ